MAHVLAMTSKGVKIYLLIGYKIRQIFGFVRLFFSLFFQIQRFGGACKYKTNFEASKLPLLVIAFVGRRFYLK